MCFAMVRKTWNYVLIIRFLTYQILGIIESEIEIERFLK
jgi:hypothetical protein